METVRESTYLGDTISANGVCDAAVTARTRCGWDKLRECSELLYGRFPLKLKGAVCKSYVRTTMLYGNEAWCLEETEMGILRRTKKIYGDAMCGVKPRNIKNGLRT